MTAIRSNAIRLATVDGNPVPPDPRVPQTDQERQLIAAYRMQPRAVQKAWVALFRAIAASRDDD